MRLFLVSLFLLAPIFSMAEEDFYYLTLRTLINGQTFRSKDLIVRDGHYLRINQVINGVDTHIQVTPEVDPKHDRSIALSFVVETQDQLGKKYSSSPRIVTLLDGTEAKIIQKSKEGKIDTGIWASIVKL